MKIGTLDIDKIYLGTAEIDRVYFGTSLIYQDTIQLDTPTISLSGDILSIQEVENAEYYDIYVDGVLEESVPAVSGYEVTVTALEQNSGSHRTSFKIYDGQDTTGTLLFSDTNAGTEVPFPITVTCLSGHLYIVLENDDYGWFNNSSTTGSITPTTFDNGIAGVCSILFTVASDGIINFGYIDWWD